MEDGDEGFRGPPNFVFASHHPFSNWQTPLSSPCLWLAHNFQGHTQTIVHRPNHLVSSLHPLGLQRQSLAWCVHLSRPSPCCPHQPVCRPRSPCSSSMTSLRTPVPLSTVVLASSCAPSTLRWHHSQKAFLSACAPSWPLQAGYVPCAPRAALLSL